MKRFIIVAIGVALVILGFLINPQMAHNAELSVEEIEAQQPTPYDLVVKHFGDSADVMWNVFHCESRHRQFDTDGTPLTSPTRDYGFSQVNEKVWNATAIKLGLDYKNSIEDNIAMAKHIYDVQGPKAWVCYQKLYTR